MRPFTQPLLMFAQSAAEQQVTPISPRQDYAIFAPKRRFHVAKEVFRHADTDTARHPPLIFSPPPTTRYRQLDAPPCFLFSTALVFHASHRRFQDD
jgi:hypothetical protein